MDASNRQSKRLSLRTLASSRQAFTLIEVMVAMLILTIGMLGLLGITILVFRNNLLSQQITEATTINTTLMDQLKSRIRVMDNTAALNCAINVDGTGTTYESVTTGSCPVLDSSGLRPVDFPPPPNAAACLVQGVIGSGTDSFTYSRITASGVETLPDPSDNFCALYSDLARNEYVRYYRVYENPATGVNNLILVTVVMWRDRFNKFRFIRLDSTVNPVN